MDSGFVLLIEWRLREGTGQVLELVEKGELTTSEDAQDTRRGFDKMHDMWRTERAENFASKSELYKVKYKQRLEKLREEEVEQFKQATKRAPRFDKGKKQGEINLRAFERDILMKEFSHGIRHQGFL